MSNSKLLLNNQRVFLASEDLYKSSSQISRKDLVSFGEIIGKFTKNNNFKITITALHTFSKHALNKVWIKNSSEMNFVYENNSLKSHIHKISDNIPMNNGVFVYNQFDVPLGFGIIAINSSSYSKAHNNDIIILRRADNGEYLEK